MKKTQNAGDVSLTKKLQILVGKRIENDGDNIHGVVTEVASYNKETVLQIAVQDEWRGKYFLTTTHLLGGITLLKSEKSDSDGGRVICCETRIGGKVFEDALNFVFAQK